ncbi:MAG TPA: nitroreductase family protein [Bacteroidales bacterium]|nr:nitroreductase family protein [Bacteroidales bacterium]
MNLLETILKRRSIRQYSDKAVEREKTEKVIRAAMFAPSGVNRRPWHFIVVDDRNIMEKIMAVHPNSMMLKTAPQAILVCGDEQQQHDTGYWIADCGAATENLLLAATALGLGSCWIGVYPREHRMRAFSEIFNLPSHIRPFALVALGYASKEKETPQRFDPGKIYLNQWSKSY